MRNYREVAEAVLERRDAYEKEETYTPHRHPDSGRHRRALPGDAAGALDIWGRLPVTGQRRDVTVRFRDLLRPV